MYFVSKNGNYTKKIVLFIFRETRDFFVCFEQATPFIQQQLVHDNVCLQLNYNPLHIFGLNYEKHILF